MAVKHHAVFLATSTDEKVRDFNIAAEAKHLPISFFNLKDLVGTLHNTLEDGGSADENAWKKFGGAAAEIAAIRNDPVAIEQFCRQRGIANYAQERVWFATEDSGVTMPQEIWDNIPRDIFSVFSEDVMDRLHKLESGPGVETAPFLSATLGSSNIQQIIAAGFSEYAKKQDYFLSLHEMDNRLLFKEESVLKIQNLMPVALDTHDVSTPQSLDTYPVLTASGVVYNGYSHSPYSHPDVVGGRASNYKVVFPRRRNPGHKTAAELGVKYIAQHSARAKLLDDLMVKINEQVQPEHALKPAVGDDKYDLAFGIAAHPEEFVVGMLNAGRHGNRKMDEALAHEGNHLKSYLPPHDETPPETSNAVELATFHLSRPERILAKSDGLVLLPDSACPPEERMSLDEKLYMLESIVVAKQLVTRDKDKPVAIVNSDHSWDEAIRIHTALADCQMTKDHALPLSYRFLDANPPEGLTGIDAAVTGNGYFSIINRNNYEEGMKAAAFILKDKSLTYHRINEPPPKTSKEGIPPTQKGLVAIFCSASSENAPLNRFGSEIARRLAEMGKGIICGGGDRYTMGAILDGVKQFRDTCVNMTRNALKKAAYIAGISTYPIAAAETNKGVMPEDYSYRELTENIYERMAKMIVPAETVLIEPGGAGTMQEWMGFNLLKKKMPALCKSKKLVVFDPDLMAHGHQSPAEPSSLQNSVFAQVLDIMFQGNANQYRLNSRFNGTGTYVVSTTDEAVQACAGQANARVRVA